MKLQQSLMLDELPREKLLKHGADKLTDVELLALILRTGGKETNALSLARLLLKHFGGLNNLLHISVSELTSFRNIGTAKACVLKATLELGLRINFSNNSLKEIKTPKHVFEVLKKDLFSKKREHFYLLSLDSRNKLLAKDLLSIGSLNETVAHPREIFRRAMQTGAAAIVVAHNHPSGDITPSTDDIELTETIAKSGKILGIPLMDHVIVAQNEYSSIRALGYFSVDD